MSKFCGACQSGACQKIGNFLPRLRFLTYDATGERILFVIYWCVPLLMLLVWLVEGYGLLLFFVVSVAAKQEGRGKLLFLNCNLSKICCQNFFS